MKLIRGRTVTQAGSRVTTANMALNRDWYKGYTDAQFEAYSKQHEELEAKRAELRPAVDKANDLIAAAKREVEELAERLGMQVEMVGLTYYPKNEKPWQDYDKEGNVIVYENDDIESWYRGGWHSSYEVD